MCFDFIGLIAGCFYTFKVLCLYYKKLCFALDYIKGTLDIELLTESLNQTGRCYQYGDRNMNIAKLKGLINDKVSFSLPNGSHDVILI